MTGSPAVLELFCGIGGCAAALPEGVRVVGALDISEKALAVYRRNFPGHPARVKLIDGLSSADLAAFGADLWWLSPPCQPFTRRGLGRDADDPRASGLLHLIGLLRESEAVRPAALALENVPGFERSRCHALLREVLDRAGYRVRETLLCPTELGVPNRRRRFYLAAALDRDPGPWGDGGWHGQRLPDLVDRTLDARESPDPPDGAPPAELLLDPEIQRRYEDALHRVDPDDPEAVTACFTAAYGRSHVRSGSYLAGPSADGAPAPLRAPRDPPPARLPDLLHPAAGPAGTRRLAAGRQQPERAGGARGARPRSSPPSRRTSLT